MTRGSDDSDSENRKGLDKRRSSYQREKKQGKRRRKEGRGMKEKEAGITNHLPEVRSHLLPNLALSPGSPCLRPAVGKTLPISKGLVGRGRKKNDQLDP